MRSAKFSLEWTLLVLVSAGLSAGCFVTSLSRSGPTAAFYLLMGTLAAVLGAQTVLLRNFAHRGLWDAARHVERMADAGRVDQVRREVSAAEERVRPASPSCPDGQGGEVAMRCQEALPPALLAALAQAIAEHAGGAKGDVGLLEVGAGVFVGKVGDQSTVGTFSEVCRWTSQQVAGQAPGRQGVLAP